MRHSAGSEDEKGFQRRSYYQLPRSAWVVYVWKWCFDWTSKSILCLNSNRFASVSQRLFLRHIQHEFLFLETEALFAIGDLLARLPVALASIAWFVSHPSSVLFTMPMPFDIAYDFSMRPLRQAPTQHLRFIDHQS